MFKNKLTKKTITVECEYKYTFNNNMFSYF